MRGDLRDLLARPLVRAIFLATGCGYAALNVVQGAIHGFVITPLAYPAGVGSQSLALFEITGDYSSVPATVAGRDVDWLHPMSAAIVMILVGATTVASLRITR